MSNNSNVNTGWKLFEEHIIDLFGCVLPGFSFLSITFLSVAVPWSICTDDFISKASALLHSQSGSFWWVLFIIFMLLSYALGELLIMGDVKEPDRKSMNYLFRRDIVRKFSEKMDVSQLMSYPRKIYEVLNKMQGKEVYEKKEILKILYAASSSLIKIKESGAANQEEEKKWLFVLAFPETVYWMTQSDNKQTEKVQPSLLGWIMGRSPVTSVNYGDTLKGYTYEKCQDMLRNSFPDINKTLDLYKTKLKIKDSPVLYYAVIKMQMEYAIDNPGTDTFPYPAYYKYLILREREDILDNISWYSQSNTSKHCINRLKLEIQMHSPEGKAIINKAESHVRHVSSIWYGFKWLLYIVIVSPVLVLSLYCIDVCNFGNTFTNFKGQIQHLVAILVSIVIMAAVVGYIKGIVIRHIHYRRTCEVQNILGVYAKVKQDMTKSID